ncbi:DNA polymerase III subunit gamma/tau [Agromyces archimandritae]|uniref:DNA polymerase III subunit gamma/tau n=1 Tax=Agromyces archimandritae TaxID=2781962 RepID=A0A975FNN4_9MICO|nr:DNA polymerase III subunit gamma/tau [Agromyces archimandritae]QTX04351.1 DNA polymerase III subunit gamma/tau [Agromyces archimandritae]
MAADTDGHGPEEDRDDDALRWAGDEDEPLAPGWKRVGEPSVVPAGEAAADAGAAESEPAPQTGAVELVVIGILGGIYLLYVVGWAITASGPAVLVGDPVGDFMYGLGRWLAVIAPVVWFLTTLWLAAGRRVPRLVWLVAGAVVLVPLPFLMRS